MKGLLNLDQNTHVFTTLGSSLSDVRVVVSDTFAVSQQSNYPKLYIPFDCTSQELREYLESETVPERYKEKDKKRQEMMKQAHQDMLYQHNLYDIDEVFGEEEEGEEEEDELEDPDMDSEAADDIEDVY